MARDDFDDDGYVSITKERYDELTADSEFLQALQAAGVNNWEGYSEAYRILREFEDDA